MFCGTSIPVRGGILGIWECVEVFMTACTLTLVSFANQSDNLHCIFCSIWKIISVVSTCPTWSSLRIPWWMSSGWATALKQSLCKLWLQPCCSVCVSFYYSLLMYNQMVFGDYTRIKTISLRNLRFATFVKISGCNNLVLHIVVLMKLVSSVKQILMVCKLMHCIV